MDCSNDCRIAALVLRSHGEEFALSFALQYVELIYSALQGYVEFASKYLLENEISQQKINSKFLHGHVCIIHLL